MSLAMPVRRSTRNPGSNPEQIGIVRIRNILLKCRIAGIFIAMFRSVGKFSYKVMLLVESPLMTIASPSRSVL